MNNNPYSKYRYDNNLSIKVRTNAYNNTVVDVFGVNLRPIGDSIRTKLHGTVTTPYGVTTLVNYIYKVERVNYVDQSICPPTYKGPTYLKPF